MRERLGYAICLNFFVVIAELISLQQVAAVRGVAMLTFYTECTNLFTMIASSIFCIAAVRSLLTGRTIPLWVRTLRFLSVTMLAIVLAVVVLVLAPLLGGRGGLLTLLFGGTMFFHHLFCPILAMLSYFILEDGAGAGRWLISLSLLPTVIYAAVLYLLNATSMVVGPYPFFMVNDLPLWLVAVAGGGLFLGALGVAVLFHLFDSHIERAKR